MNEFPLFDSSLKATTTDLDGAKARIGAEKYPWRYMPVGKSFHVATKEGKPSLQTLQSSCSKWSKKLGFRFKAVKHETGIEVARLPDANEPSIDKNEHSGWTAIKEAVTVDSEAQPIRKLPNLFE